MFINEVHYFEESCTACKFVEVAFTTGLDKSQYALYYYVPDRLVGSVTSVSQFTDGSSSNGLTFAYRTNLDIEETGALALVQGSSTVLQFLTFPPFEFVASDGPAAGMTAEVIGLETSTSTSIQLENSGCQYGDFSWGNPIAPTKGSVNTAQSITGC